MRRAAELLVNRVLRSRYGLALSLAAIVAIVVSGAHLLGGARADVGLRPDADQSTATLDPSAGDDGLTSPAPPASPTTRPGTAEPIAVARAFAAAWLHHDVSAKGWYAALLPLSTRELAAKLNGVYPAGVPADRITGTPALVPRGDTFVEVTIPVDSGVLRLRLIAPGGRWLVDGVDWERG